MSSNLDLPQGEVLLTTTWDMANLTHSLERSYSTYPYILVLDLDRGWNSRVTLDGKAVSVAVLPNSRTLSAVGFLPVYTKDVLVQVHDEGEIDYIAESPGEPSMIAPRGLHFYHIEVTGHEQ